MTNPLYWELTHCGGYIVPPCKDMEEDKAIDMIQGSSINVHETPVIQHYFRPLFDRVYEDCRIPIRFVNTKDNGEPQNDIRDLIRILAFSTNNEEKESASKILALRLALASDQRSQKGLFIVAAGHSSQSNQSQVVLWKFPADQSIQATFNETGISVQLIEGAFSRNLKYFKASVFRDEEAEKSFWEGLVEDRQSTEGTKFWIQNFLQATPNLTDVRGTRLVAYTLREIINDEPDYRVQDGIISGAIAIQSQKNRPITIKEISEKYLPESVRDQFEKQLEAVLEIPFTIDIDTLEDQFGIRTIILNSRNSRVNITAPIKDFEDIIEINNDLDGVARIVIVGEVAGGKVKTSRGFE